MILFFLILTFINTILEPQEPIVDKSAFVDVDYLIDSTLYAIYYEYETLNTDIDNIDGMFKVISKCDHLDYGSIELLQCKYSIISDLNNM